MAHAFISYSHLDEQFLNRLHTHMSQLKREGQLTSWFDGQIPAGGSLNTQISNELQKAGLFLAIVSPDYLASSYCYDIEFQDALRRFAAGTLKIVPIIAQPCDWKASPFGQFKAIPKDGKPISEWTNENNAYLNIIDELRRLITEPAAPIAVSAPTVNRPVGNQYKVKRDFDPVDQLNFRDESFKEIHEYFIAALEEINGVQEIKARFVRDTAGQEFTCVVTNRAKIGTTGYISIGLQQNDHFGRNGITFAMSERLNQNVFGNGFTIAHNDYELFWSKQDLMSNTQAKEKLTAKQIAKMLWEQFIDQVGITF